jgi:hypothetical protein
MIKIERIQYTRDSKSFKDGNLQIDEESEIISLLKPKRTLRGQSEEIICKLSYSTKAFPQFENNTLRIKEYGVIVESDKDRKKITEVLTKPLRELEQQTSLSIKKADEAITKMLLNRAQALETLLELKKNPRRELFSAFPDILSNFSDPINETVNRQKSTIASALSQLTTEMSTLEQEVENSRALIVHFQKFAIAVGAAQDALFEGGEFKLRTSQDILKSLEFSPPVTENLSVSEFTKSALEELTQKKHQYALNIALRVVRCDSCGKYYSIDSYKSCPYCNLSNNVTPK